jgi:hypothetical protein
VSALCRRVLAVRAAALLLLVAVALPARAGGGDVDWRQAADLEGFGAVDIVVRADSDASPPAAELLLEDKAGNVAYRFPPLPGTGTWGYYQTGDVALVDVDADGRLDVVVIVELMTGIGPGGADPFRQAGVYLRRGDGFERAEALEEAVNEPPGFDRWADMAGLLRVLGEIEGDGTG